MQFLLNFDDCWLKKYEDDQNKLHPPYRCTNNRTLILVTWLVSNMVLWMSFYNKNFDAWILWVNPESEVTSCLTGNIDKELDNWLLAVTAFQINSVECVGHCDKAQVCAWWHQDKHSDKNLQAGKRPVMISHLALGLGSFSCLAQPAAEELSCSTGRQHKTRQQVHHPWIDQSDSVWQEGNYRLQTVWMVSIFLPFL